MKFLQCARAGPKLIFAGIINLLIHFLAQQHNDEQMPTPATIQSTLLNTAPVVPSPQSPMPRSC